MGAAVLRFGVLYCVVCVVFLVGLILGLNANMTTGVKADLMIKIIHFLNKKSNGCKRKVSGAYFVRCCCAS